MSALSEAGFEAIEQRNWPEAIEKLTKAIDQSKAPAWLLARSQAFMETGQLDKAIADAEYAYCTAAERGNDKSRKQMIEAQYRRSVCYFRKREYANADICAVWSQRLAKGVAVREAKSVQQEGVDDNGFYFATVEQAMAEEGGKKTAPGAAAAAAATGDPMAKLSAVMGAGDAAGKPPYERDWNKAQIWRSQVLRFLESLPGDDPARRVTVQLTPVKPTLQGPDAQPAKTAAAQATPAKPGSQGNGAQPAAGDAVKPAQAPAPDYSTFRTQFYQSDTSMTVSVFMKFASKEEMDKMEVRFVQGGKFVVVKGVPRQPPVLFIEFHDRVSVDKSTHRVASMKLELTLAKEVPGKWHDFGTQGSSLPTALKRLQDPDLLTWIGTAGTPGEPSTNESATPPAPDSPPKETPATAPTASAKAPTYPTSSKTGPKDWDNILKDDDVDDDDNAGDVDSFFKKLYKDSTPEQQRAMLKSYTESNGTSLSTDWNQVSQGLDMDHKD